MTRDTRYKTARCVLRCESRFLLAVHSSFWLRPGRRWGLPGGAVEWREAPHEAMRRELMEELYLEIDSWEEVGAFSYKGAEHMVYGVDIATPVADYDDHELIDIGWFTLDAVRDMAGRRKLHAGYELAAIERYLENF